MSSTHLFTSEAVGMGHPDKLCDQVSDAILDAFLAQDQNSRVACETLATTGQIVIAGEVKSSAMEVLSRADEIARKTICDIGYTNPDYGIDGKSCGILVALHGQSPDINQGVDRQEGDQGAGDQGMMFGFACNETPDFMPLPMALSRKIVQRQAELRAENKITWLRPDCKSQVTIEYEEGWKPKRVTTVVVSTQHSPEVEHKTIEEGVIEEIIKPTLPADLDTSNITYHVNPTGRFVIGGPHGDTGLTGRKIVVDTYGGMARNGGGAFSGKDPSKVDRSAAYATRWIAKNLVAAGLCERCEIEVAYAIGVAEPVSLFVETFGTAKVEPQVLAEIVRKHVSLKPAAIAERLNLLQPLYLNTARHGHFGDFGFDYPWERLDLVDAFKSEIS